MGEIFKFNIKAHVRNMRELRFKNNDMARTWESGQCIISKYTVNTIQNYNIIFY